MAERILLADDHGIVRLGLSLIIKKLRPQAEIEEVDNYRSVLDIIARQSFDLIILDINMPDGNFHETLEIIKIKYPKIKVLIFSSQEEHIYAIRYLKMGADGFLHKLAPENVIKGALEKILNKGTYMSEDVIDNLVLNSLHKYSSSENPITSLSDREMEIAEKLIKGTAVKEIGNELHLHVSTVSTYKNRLFAKLNVQTLPELIELFRFYGVWDPK